MAAQEPAETLPDAPDEAVLRRAPTMYRLQLGSNRQVGPNSEISGLSVT